MNKSFHKSELARMAGVSYSTFNRYLKAHRSALDALGSPLKSHTLRGKALDYVCANYDIDLPDEPEPAPMKHVKFR